jgi:hypothetical protein
MEWILTSNLLVKKDSFAWTRQNLTRTYLARLFANGGSCLQAQNQNLPAKLSAKINLAGVSFTSVPEARIPKCEVFLLAPMDMVFVSDKKPAAMGRGRCAIASRIL